MCVSRLRELIQPCVPPKSLDKYEEGGGLPLVKPVRGGCKTALHAIGSLICKSSPRPLHAFYTLLARKKNCARTSVFAQIK